MLPAQHDSSYASHDICPSCGDGPYDGCPCHTANACTEDPNTGSVYTCSSYVCPVHGDRNLDLPAVPGAPSRLDLVHRLNRRNM